MPAGLAAKASHEGQKGRRGRVQTEPRERGPVCVGWGLSIVWGGERDFSALFVAYLGLQGWTLRMPVSSAGTAVAKVL